MEKQANRQIETIVAENITAARTAKNFTRRALAAEMDGRVDPLAIYRWERAGVLPNAQNMQALADALGQTVGWFYTDHQSNGRAA